jgi:hypothetical protein
MKKQIIWTIVIGLSIINIVNPILASKTTNEEIIDQSQTDIGTGCIIWNHFLAQSFKPSMSPLTKVELPLWWGDPKPDVDVIVSIRENLCGNDLVSAKVDGNEFINEYGWIEFDFEDLEVSTGKTYYIVFHLDPFVPEQNDKVYWSFGWVGGLIKGWIYDPYRPGRLYMKNNDILWGFWHRGYAPWQGQFDFCFKTYTYG